jgi:hypothetical protein
MKKKESELTPEERATALAAKQKARTDAQAEQERVELYRKSLTNASYRQVRGELRRFIRRENAGRNIAWATVLLAVFENTKTEENRNGRLHAYPH